VPSCMEARLSSVSGTGLISQDNSFGSNGVLCAFNTSVCSEVDGCGCDA